MVWKLLVLLAVILVTVPITESQDTTGYELPPQPTYMILAPKKVRPGQVYQVSVSTFRLIYGQLTIHLSIKRDTPASQIEYCFATDTFKRASTRLMQLKMPDSTLPGGTYWLHVQGSVAPKGGLLFENRTRLDYDGKKVSLFIQLSKPLYSQSQVVRFRVIPIRQNLLADFGTLSRISVIDSSNTTVRRWYNIMSNAGGIVELEFTLAYQISEGTWKIQATKDDFTYEKTFEVKEYWRRRFDVNVTMPRRLSNYGFGVYGLIMANKTSGRPVKGNATVLVEIRDPSKTLSDPPMTTVTRTIPVFEGKSDFMVTMSELETKLGDTSLANKEVYVKVRVIDWFLLLEYTGTAYSFIYSHVTQVTFMGGEVRPFKPGLPFDLLMVLHQPDGTRVKYITNRFIELKLYCDLQTDKEEIHKITIPDSGVITYTFTPSAQCVNYRCRANYMETKTIIRRDGTSAQNTTSMISFDEQRIFKSYSSSDSYLQISTSTTVPQVNDYMIFNIRSTYYTRDIYYQISAGGNIIFADRLDMPSNTLSKTFSVSLSRDMAPIARIFAYYVKLDGEIVADALTFFVNIEKLNNVKVAFNRGKDFNVDSMEIKATATPGSFIAFSALHYDLFIKGGSTILQDHDITDELETYESHAQRPFNYTWYDDQELMRREYFPTPTSGADTNSTANVSGLIMFTDANFTKANFYHDCNETKDPSRAFPCYSYKGPLCYSRAQRCDGLKDCTTGYDEINCPIVNTDPQPKDTMGVFQRLWRHYDDGHWMWQSFFMRHDGTLEFKVALPKIDTSWVVGAFSVDRDTGFSLMKKPAMMSGIRRFFITVEMPDKAVWGEQIGIRVAVFNYWNYWIESLVEIKQSDQFDIVWVKWRGAVNSYSPDVVRNKTVQTLVYLEAGESTYIYMPIIPRNKTLTVVTICAYTFIGMNCETRNVTVRMNGVANYYHTAMLLNMTLTSSQYVTNFDILVPQMFWEPEQRQLRYVPGSPKGDFAISGDVVGPTLSADYTHATSYNVLRRPADACENVLFEFGYNAELMMYLRDSNQLTRSIRDNALEYLYDLLQRMMSYFNYEDGNFAQFRENKNLTSPFLAAFAMYVFGEIEPIRQEINEMLYIPEDVMMRLVLYLSSHQRDDGSFNYDGVGDRKYYVDYPDVPKPSEELRRVPVTALVLMALANKDLQGNYGQGPIKTKAIKFLTEVQKEVKDPFSLSMLTYALASARQINTQSYNELMKMAYTGQGQYWSNTKIQRIGKRTNKAGQQIINPRIEWPNDGYATQTTSMALLSYYTSAGSTGNNVSTIVDWLQQMRNTDKGFASTQDSFWALKALREVAHADRDRNIYALNFFLKLTSNSSFNRTVDVRKETLSVLHKIVFPTEYVWGEVFLKGEGTGQALLQLDVQKNVRETYQIKYPRVPFDPDTTAVLHSFYSSCVPSFSGRNASIMRMTACGKWVATDAANQSGIAVFEIDLPTGFVVQNDDLRHYVESRSVSNLRRAMYRPGKIHFYFDHMNTEETCVRFRADRWYPVANMTENYKCELFEYYEPGRRNASKYESQSLFTNSICNVCGSYQCPYCPDYNISSVMQFSIILALVCMLFVFYNRRATTNLV